MATQEVVDSLKARSEFVRESLQRSQTITDSVVSVLGSFDHRLSALETAMRSSQVRTHSIRRAHENLDKTLNAAEVILAQFDLTRKAEAKILRGPHEDLDMHLEAITQLRAIIKFFSSHKYSKSTGGIINHANNLLAIAISKLEDEFRQVLSHYSKPVEPDRLYDCIPNSGRKSLGQQADAKKGDDSGKRAGQQNKRLETAVYTPPVLIPPRVLPLLHDLSKHTTLAGHQQQVFKTYRDVRSSVLEQSLRKLGVERISKDEVQKLQWEVLENKISQWNHHMRIAVKLLFSAEKKICDKILDGASSLKEQCFAEVTSNSVSVLFSLGDAVVKSKRSPEKLFVLLDMYETMRELNSEIEAIFAGKACTEMRDGARNLGKKLAETIVETFGDFEEAVGRDSTKTADQDGTVHPLTSYVIKYIKFSFDYKATLKQLFQETFEGDPDTQLGSLTRRIIQALLANLDGKSKQYKDPGLTQIFLMNNIHYIVRSVRRSEAKYLLGDDWVQIHRRIVQQHANQYKRVSWAKILQCLTVASADGTGGSSTISKANLRERFKTFNGQFEELHHTQTQWTVPDNELRESLRLAVAEVLLPAYRSFLKRFGLLVDGGKGSSKYIKYSPDDLERLLSEFFENKTSND